MSSKQQTIKEEGDKTSVDRGKVNAKLEPSKKPSFLETYLNVKKDGHGKTLKPLLAEYTREMQERTSHGVESEESLCKIVVVHVARQLARANANENGHDYQEIECSTQMLTHCFYVHKSGVKRAQFVDNTDKFNSTIQGNVGGLARFKTNMACSSSSAS